jgi:DNA-binding beta-propeller fold protein YncE
MKKATLSMGAVILTLAVLAAAGERHVIKKIAVPGDYGWDYLTADSEGRQLYVSHDREVVVIDLDSEAIIGSVPGTRIHGIAIDRELGRGFISASDPGSVTVFDLKTLAVINKVRVGDDPNAIFYDPFTKRVFTIDRGSKRVSAIDPKSGKVVGSVEGLGGRIDARALKVTDTWKVAPCEQPSSMDMDRTTHRIFIGCRSGVMTVVDAATGRLVTTQPIGKGVDASEFDPGRGLVYFSTGADGAMWVFHQDTPEKYTLVETVKTQPGSRTMAVDRKTGKAYLSVAEFGPAPAPAPDGGRRGRAPMIPGTFSVLVVGQ